MRLLFMCVLFIEQVDLRTNMDQSILRILWLIILSLFRLLWEINVIVMNQKALEGDTDAKLKAG